MASSRRWSPLCSPGLGLFLVAAAAACGGGGGACSCLAPIPGGFPIDDHRHAGALQLRMTSGGIGWLNQNGKSLVTSLLPGGSSTINVPPSCGGKNEVCCGMPAPMCRLDVQVQNTLFTPTPPNVLKFDVTAQLKTLDPLPVTFDTGFIGTAKCFVSIDTTKSTTQYKAIDLVSDVTFAVDGTTDLTSIKLANTTVDHLDASMLTLKSQPGDFLCTVANFGAIKSFIITQLQKQLGAQLSSTATDSLCASCMAQTDCDGYADGCKSGKCQRMGACLQEIGATGQLDIGKLFAGLSPSTSAKMDLLNVLGHYADVAPTAKPGLSLGLIGGGKGDPHSACVPMRSPPPAPTVDKWMAYDQEVEPRTMLPYHLGFGLHVSHLNTMAYSAFDAGALCLSIGTPSVALLSSKTIGVIIPSLSDITHVDNAPLYLRMRPAQEPVLTLGAGTFLTDMSGKKTIDDALLHISVPSFSIDFYAWVEERYVRVMTLTADVVLGVSLDVDDKGQIVPLIGDLGKAFTNVKVSNSELLAEDPVKLAKVFPMLLGLAVGQVGGALKPIAVPSVMGLNLKIVAIEPTDGMQFLSIFANLATGGPDAFHAVTRAQLVRVVTPPTAAFAELDPALQPRVELALDGEGIDGSSAELEWQTSLDGDELWSPWSQTRSLTHSDPRLWLQGKHFLSVRARMRGQAETTGPSVRVDFIVDTVAPVGQVEVAGDEARFVATDNVSEAAQLEYRWHVGDGVWSAWSSEDHVRVPSAQMALLVVEARDEAKNGTFLAFHGRTTTPSTGGCGCELGGHRSDERSKGALALVLALAGGLVLARRRRASLPALVAVAALGLGLLAACNGDAPVVTLGKGDVENPLDEIGRYSDAQAYKGVIKVSAYDDTNGDLAYAEVAIADTGKPITWQWVDGVPAGPVDTMGGYRGGITDPGDDIGRYTSLALSKAGDPRVAYWDTTHSALKFASASSSDRKFSSAIVDAGMPATVTGVYASLSLDAMDVPSIAYVVSGVPNGSGGYVSRLRLATAKSKSPAGPGDWTLTTLDESPITCAGTGKKSLCPTGQVCVDTDAADHSKSVCKPMDAAPCPKMCATASACIGGACVVTLAPVAAPDLLEGTGLFAQLRRLKSGLRLVAYYNREEGDLNLQVETAAGQFSKVLVDGNSPSTDLGQFAAMAVGPDDKARIAYVDAIHDRLLYREVTGSTPAMAETVDDGVRSDGPHAVGSGAALWTDGTIVKVAYQDQATSDLWMATRSGGTWSKVAVRMGTPGYGFYPHLVSDGGKLYLTELVYDRGVEAPAALGSLEIRPLN